MVLGFFRVRILVLGTVLVFFSSFALKASSPCKGWANALAALDQVLEEKNEVGFQSPLQARRNRDNPDKVLENLRKWKKIQNAELAAHRAARRGKSNSEIADLDREEQERKREVRMQTLQQILKRLMHPDVFESFLFWQRTWSRSSYRDWWASSSAILAGTIFENYDAYIGNTSQLVEDFWKPMKVEPRKNQPLTVAHVYEMMGTIIFYAEDLSDEPIELKKVIAVHFLQAAEEIYRRTLTKVDLVNALERIASKLDDLKERSRIEAPDFELTW